MPEDERIDFPATGLDFPQISSPEAEEAIRLMARSLAVTISTAAPHQWGSIRIQKTGFANLAQLIVPVTCKDGDLSALIPVARQKAFMYLAERGVDDHHLRVVPGVSRAGKRSKFTDQQGRNRFGQKMTVAFDLSDTLAAAVEWDWTGKGTLKPAWDV